MSGQEPGWRVYLNEWLAVHTADVSGQAGREECQAVYARKYGGRVRVEDVRVMNVQYPRLEVRLPNLQGEFRDYDDAVELAGGLVDRHPDVVAVVVQRGSDEEKALLEYGKKMLPGVR